MAALPVDPSPPRVDSPSCVSSYPALSGPEGSPAPDQDVAVTLPEPMVITVEASPSGAQEGEVPIIHVASQQAGGPVASCSHEDVNIMGVISAQEQPCLLPGSFEQTAKEEPALGQQMGSLGACKESCGVADRLRAAVASRGFEPCPVSEQPACGAPDSAQEVAAGSCAAAVSCEGPRAMVLCHQDTTAGNSPLCPPC